MSELDEQLKKCIELYIKQKTEEIEEEIAETLERSLTKEYQYAIDECKRNLDLANDYIRCAEESFNIL